MKLRSALLSVAAFAAAAFLLPSCSVRPDVTLNADGSGEALVRVSVQRSLADYLDELAAFAAGGTTGTGVFDEKATREAFAQRPGVEVKSIKVPDPKGLGSRKASGTPEELELRLAFRSIGDLVRGANELTDSGIVVFRSDGATRTLKLHLDKQNFAKVSSLLPSSDGSAETILGVFGPQQGVTITEAEYLESMEFILGEAGPPAIRASSIDVTVTVNGKLISQKGGSVRGNTVTFRIPLLSVLLLNQSLDYEIVFQ